MKKNFLAMMSLLFMTLAVFTLTSCGDDDDKNGGTPASFNNALLGGWHDNAGNHFSFVLGPNGQVTGDRKGEAVTWYINTAGQLVATEYDGDVKIYSYVLNGNQLSLTRVNDDDHDHYVLYRDGSDGGGGQIDQALLGIWAGTKQYDNDTYIFTFAQNGEGSKKEIDSQDRELDVDYFTWSINSNGQLEIRENGDNEIKIYTYVVNGQNLTLTRVYGDNDNYSLSRRVY